MNVSPKVFAVLTGINLPSGFSVRSVAMGEGGSGEIATGMRPSEAFYQELQKAHDSLSPKMQEIFKTANFKPVHNLGEVFGEKRVNTLGAWVLDGNNLYMAENTGFKNALRLNNDIQHVFRHELGHMLNDTIGSLTGTVASDMPNFIKAFNADLKLNNPKLAEALKEIGKTCGTINQQWHEIFADMLLT